MPKQFNHSLTSVLEHWEGYTAWIIFVFFHDSRLMLSKSEHLYINVSYFRTLPDEDSIYIFLLLHLKHWKWFEIEHYSCQWHPCSFWRSQCSAWKMSWRSKGRVFFRLKWIYRYHPISNCKKPFSFSLEYDCYYNTEH